MSKQFRSQFKLRALQYFRFGTKLVGNATKNAENANNNATASTTV